MHFGPFGWCSRVLRATSLYVYKDRWRRCFSIEKQGWTDNRIAIKTPSQHVSMRKVQFMTLKLALNMLNVMFDMFLYMFSFIHYSHSADSLQWMDAFLSKSQRHRWHFIFALQERSNASYGCTSLLYQAVVWPVDTSPTHKEQWLCKCWKGLAPLVGMRATTQPAPVALFVPLGSSKTNSSDSSCPPKHRYLFWRHSRQTPVAASFPVHRLCSSAAESSDLICLRQQQLIMRVNPDAPGRTFGANHYR